MGFSFWHIVVVALLVVVLFGRGKVSGLMGDVAKGIRSFKRTMAEDDRKEPPAAPPEVRDPAPRIDDRTKV